MREGSARSPGTNAAGPSRLLNLEPMNPLLHFARAQLASVALTRSCSGMPRRLVEPFAGALVPSCHRSLRRGAQHSSHSGDVAGGHGELEVMIDTPESSVDGLTDVSDRL